MKQNALYSLRLPVWEVLLKHKCNPEKGAKSSSLFVSGSIDFGAQEWQWKATESSIIYTKRISELMMGVFIGKHQSKLILML